MTTGRETRLVSCLKVLMLALTAIATLGAYWRLWQMVHLQQQLLVGYSLVVDVLAETGMLEGTGRVAELTDWIVTHVNNPPPL